MGLLCQLTEVNIWRRVMEDLAVILKSMIDKDPDVVPFVVRCMNAATREIVSDPRGYMVRSGMGVKEFESIYRVAMMWNDITDAKVSSFDDDSLFIVGDHVI